MYKSLQAGRAIAAILVVLYHLGRVIAAEKYFGIPSLAFPFSFGTSGVEFFFVLSGFIILTAHRKDISKPLHLKKYLLKRLIRIYPTYIIIFLGVYLLTQLTPSLQHILHIDGILFLKSLLLFPQLESLVSGLGAPILIVAWTLQYEVLFYAYFSFLIIHKKLSILVGMALFVGVGFFSYDLNLTTSVPFLYQQYILLFIVGMAVSRVAFSMKQKMIRPQLPLIIGLMLFALVAIDTLFNHESLKNIEIILYGIASALIIFGLVKLEENGRIFGGSNLLQQVGNASYALYLIHVPLISVLAKVAIKIHLNQFGIIGALTTYFIILFLCLTCSVLFHRHIEKPIINYLHLKFITSKNRVA